MPKRDRTDNYEIVQWLFQNPAKRTGPEQIWIRGWTHYDYEYKKGGQYEASTVFTLGAGAMEFDLLDMADYELCVDGQHFSSNRTTALVMEMPGLWVHRIIPLTIHREDPLSDLEPMFEFFQQRSNLKELSPPVNALDVVEDPISEACSNVARSWLSACVGSHARCKQLSGNEIPTRLIDVGATDGSQRPRLEKIAANSQGIPYVTLSHCWGDPSHITRLTKGNIAELMEEIDEVALSKSFQDAINITRALDIRYLWIDALCIIQDSAEDWAIESTRMAQYYRSGRVMISALASPGAGHGILHPRTGDANAVKYSLNGNELFIRPALEDAWTVIQDDHHGSDVRQDISVQPLNSRAWTLQERLFAPRIIHYSVQQLIWQCKTCIASEDNQFEFMSGGKVISPVIDMINLDTERSGKNKRPTPLSTGWYNLLGGYTKRQITYSSDLLPGISGLAQEVQNLTGVKYLAGIWNGPPAILMSILLWEVEHRDGKAATRANNGSPSWSWASVRAKITHQLHEMFWIEQPDIDPKFFLREAKLATSNPFGQVSGGRIQVSGFVHAYTGSSTFAEYQTRKLVERITLGDEKERDPWGSKMIIYDNTEDNLIDPYTEIQKLIALGEAQKEPVVELDIPDEEYDFSRNDHILLFMSRWDQVSNSTDDLSTEQYFLLLRRVETEGGSKKALGGEEWPIFERVGIAKVGPRHMLDISESEGWERRNGIIV